MNPQKNERLCELLARCTFKDQSAFASLYDLMSGELKSYAYRFLLCEELCKEAIQESMLQVWDNASAFDRNKAKASTWIYSIVKYRALDKLKAEGKHHLYANSAYSNNASSSYEQSKVDPDSLAAVHQPEQESIVLENIYELQTHFSRLSENEQKSVTLAHIEGYSRNEIAIMFNTNVNTVKSWVRRGLQHLKDEEWEYSKAS